MGPPREDEGLHRVVSVVMLRVSARGKVGRCPVFCIRGELGDWRPVGCPVHSLVVVTKWAMNRL
jgi:hypothetical protein